MILLKCNQMQTLNTVQIPNYDLDQNNSNKNIKTMSTVDIVLTLWNRYCSLIYTITDILFVGMIMSTVLCTKSSAFSQLHMNRALEGTNSLKWTSPENINLCK